ncbi:MAG: cadherin-like beta sandwich domain-containing protein, partial [Clostridiales bacterium]
LYIRPQATAMGAKISLKPLDYGEKLEEVAEGVYLFPIANQLQQGECRTFRITLGIGDYPRRTVDVAITRGVSGSDDATLAGVKFLSSYRQDQSNTALMISPAFSADVLNYKLYLPADAANFTVWPDPAAREDQVSVTVNGAAWLGGNSYKDLPGRTKTVEIAVTAENLQDRRT